jgi:hypothetical protein
MEVHHHPKVEKKNFKEYFLEFLMIFLAVTMGFFAENVREHFEEKKITHQYLESLQLELLHNKNVFYAADSLYKSRLPVEDSIVKIFKAKQENEELNTMARLIATSRNQYSPPIEISAYNQLINSGGLRYLDNVPFKDSLAKYESLIESFKTYNATVNNYMLQAFPGITQLEDLSDYVNRNENHTYVMMPYPELTDKERREITNYYTYHFIRTYANLANIDGLINADNHLYTMIENEIKNY